MPRLLRYGTSGVELNCPHEVLVAFCEGPRMAAISNVERAVDAAVSAPLDYPPLVQAVVPGDKVAVALGPAVPKAATLVAGVVRHLIGRGVSAGDITIVIPGGPDAVSGEDDPRSRLDGAERLAVGLAVHEPENRERLCLLTPTSSSQRAVYLHRALVEADFVVAIGCVRDPSTPGYHGILGVIFPALSDADTIRRFRQRPRRLSGGADGDSEVDEVGWLLGVQFIMAVVPGEGDEVLAVLAGEPAAVAKRAADTYRQAWNHDVPCRAQLVVASVTGNSVHQTWANAAQAVRAALRVVTDDGAIALCTQLEAEPGPAVRRLVVGDDRRAALDEIECHSPSDAEAAGVLARATERSRLYLLSRLDHDLVEDLDIVPLESADDLARLERQCASLIVLGNAQFAQASAADAAACGD